MNAVSNQLPYEEIKPIPEPKREAYPRLLQLVSRVMLVVAITGLGAGYGAVFGLWLNISSIIPTVVGGVIGLVAGGILASTIPVASRITRYRTDTLDLIKKASSDHYVLSFLDNIRGFFTYSLNRFKQTYDNHELHRIMTMITEMLDPTRKDIKKVWGAFLKHLHGTKVTNPDGRVVKLDFSLTLRKLQGKEIEVEAGILNKDNPSYDDALSQIERIQKTSFGRVGTVSKERMKHILSQDEENKCFIAKRKNSQKVLGFAWCHKEEDKLILAGLARRPGAACLRIGDDLMVALINDLLPKAIPMELKVRKSNTMAIRLYEKYDFEKVEELPNYYPEGPEEDAVRMKLNWEAIRARCKPQQAVS